MAARPLLASACAIGLLALTPRGTTPLPGPPALPLTAPGAAVPPQPIRFEINAGQVAERADALVQNAPQAATVHRGALTVAMEDGTARAVRLRMLGGGAPAPVFGERRPGVANYLLGPDPSAWRLRVPSYDSIAYPGIYRGIDVVYHARRGDLEFDFVVQPGADPDAIALTFDGADRLHIGSGGELHVDAGRGGLRLAAPRVYQDDGSGSRDIDGRYRLDGNIVRFEIGRYDATQPLVIDPVLLFTVYPGGYAVNYMRGVAMSADPAGNVYVTATAYRPLPYRQYENAGVFVMKIDAATRAEVYRTYLGSNSGGVPYDIAVNAAGEVYVYGSMGMGFPEAGGYRYNCPCDYGQFVAKLNAAGDAMIYQARMRASLEHGGSIALDGTGHLWLTGTTAWAGPGFEPCCLPIVEPSQPAFGGATDVYVLRLNPAGTDVVFGSYLGGASVERAAGIDVGGDGSVYITGTTESDDFPTVNPVQPAPGGFQDLFVTRLSATGAVTFSTLLGGSDDDIAAASTIDAEGFVYLAGRSSSLDFPVVNAAWPRPPAANAPIAVKLSPASRSVVYATFFGGSGVDIVRSVASDSSGALLIGGTTSSPDFPRLRAFQEYMGNSMYPSDGFVVQLAAGGTPLDASVIGRAGGDDEVAALAALSGGRFLAVTNVLFIGSPGNMAVNGMSTALAISSVLPRVLPPEEGGWVKIAGQNFAPGTRVYIGGMFATSVETENVTSVVARLPALPPGTYDIAVSNPAPYDQVAVLPDAVQYADCTFSLPWTLGFAASGGTRSITVPSAPWGCGWVAESTAPWIDVLTQAGVGYGGPLTIRVAPNPSSSPRVAFVRVNGHSIQVTQAALAPLDLDADGRVDLLWQHTGDGRLLAWLMNGTAKIGEQPLVPGVVADTGWAIAGSGDLDGDGAADLVWQHDDGRIAAWVMDGMRLRDGLPLVPGAVDDTSWRIRTVGDVNGDGRADLIWQHTVDGRLAAWIMDGVMQRWGIALEPAQVPDVSWRIAGNGDFNDDGQTDLVWQHTDGRVAVWLMNGLSLMDGRLVTQPVLTDPAWRVRAVGDLDGDGSADLIWHHAADGRVAAWLMRGLVCMEATLLTPADGPGAGWTLVSPR